ncbi:hypothetical protein BGW38_007004 [Lunasporangiospora selenospora]|uniref:Uncharacterized protein n=1 Tax=Lunasporangiospora selenospora TaxID=979761 RepID=A0A9P6FMZ2_9FUNG|nr:hypothetical protein BGW38_007004 [Lunasporangiospora selenospora]
MALCWRKRPKIDKWLRTKYKGEDIPEFERNDETRKVLLKIIYLNNAQDATAEQARQELEHLSMAYRSEAHKIQEVLQILGIAEDSGTASPSRPALILTDKDTLQILDLLAELALILGADNTTPPSFIHGLSQLHLEALEQGDTGAMASDSTPAMSISSLQKIQLDHLETRVNLARSHLDTLLNLREQWQDNRRQCSDDALRARRRSTELRRLKTTEEREQWQRTNETMLSNATSVLSGNGTRLDHHHSNSIEARGLTVTQLALQDQKVLDLGDQIDAQNKILAAYQDIPPDYSLARLKLQEAEMQLEELSGQHEMLMHELAHDL